MEIRGGGEEEGEGDGGGESIDVKMDIQRIRKAETVLIQSLHRIEK